jgi:hypothetical protein
MAKSPKSIKIIVLKVKISLTAVDPLFLRIKHNPHVMMLDANRDALAKKCTGNVNLML